MKKYFIIILAVLLLFSFTSCKDKSEEITAEYEKKINDQKAVNESIIKNYEDFWDVYYTAHNFWMIYTNFIKADGEYAYPSSDSDSYLSNMHDAGIILIGLEDGETFDNYAKITSATGTVNTDNYSNSEYTSNKDLIITNNVFGVEYKVNTDEEKAVDKTTTATVSGSFHISKGEGYISYDVDLTINDNQYNASWTVDPDSSSPKKFTKAKVNGQDVDIRLLNETGFKY